MAAEVKRPLPSAMNQHHGANSLCSGNRFKIESGLLERLDPKVDKNDGLRSLLWSFEGESRSTNNDLNNIAKDEVVFGLKTNPATSVQGKNPPTGASNYTTKKDGLYSKAGSNQRRSIFGSFWKREGSVNSDNGDAESDTQSATSSRSSRGHRRAASTSAVPCSPCMNPGKRPTPAINTNAEAARGLINVMMFSPPVQHKSVILGRFEGLENLPPDIHMSLPLLPSPLSRTYRTDGSHYSGGVYPLNPVRPILKKSSYTVVTPDEHDEGDDKEQQAQESDVDSLSPLKGGYRKPGKTCPPMVMPMPLALTDSVHLSNCRRKDGKTERELIQEAINEADSSSDDSSSSDQSQRSLSVRFDPRVTITEYHDELPRQWYSDTELDKFKVETILLAQQFLKSRPDLLVEYCSGRINPVTGVTRRKALYCLPVLNDVSEEGESEPTTATSKPSLPSKTLFEYNYAALARDHVQKILIVDPNKLILDLFRKSLQQIFPHAEIVTVQTGNEALGRVAKLFKSKSRGFDLIIIEERLDGMPLHCIGQSPPLLEAERKRSEDGPQGSLSLTRVKHSSMTQLEGSSNHVPTCPQKYISGAKVIAKIKLLEEKISSTSPIVRENKGSDGEVNEQDPSWQKSMKIGVCLDQKKDTLKLWQSGADLVWGKPPPPMGENLRNQLVATLVEKRSPST